MSSLYEMFLALVQKTRRADEAAAWKAATKALERCSIDPEKAYNGFYNNIRASGEIRAIIGADALAESLAAYLQARASDMQNKASAQAGDAGGVQSEFDSHRQRGPAGASHTTSSAQAESGGVQAGFDIHIADVPAGTASPNGEEGGVVQALDDSQSRRGPAASTKPVPVTAYRRNFPGHARQGLAEAKIAAKLAPAVYAPALSDGRKVMPMTYREARQERPKRLRDAVLLDMLLAYAQPASDTMRLQDTIPVDIFKQREAWTKDYMSLADERITMTVEAFIAMKEQAIKASPETQQIQPIG